MKKYSELSIKQKEAAKDIQIHKIMNGIISGSIKFSDQELQKEVIRICYEMEINDTPWFINEHLLENVKIRENIIIIAMDMCEKSFYLEKDEDAVSIDLLDELIAEKNEKIS